MAKSSVDLLAENVERADGSEAKAEARAKLGIGLAQLGRIRESTEILESLRSQCRNSESARLGIQLIILEGVLWYYDTRSSDSFDRIRRANALARAAGVQDLEIESAVWLAHTAFNFEHYDALATAMRVALENFDSIDDGLRARVCLVIADANQFLGNRPVSSDWYTFARIFSRRIHDHATVAAIEYNRLIIGLGRIKVDRVLGLLTPESMHRDWLTELGSVERLQEGFDANALSDLTLLCQSLVCQSRGNFSGALNALLQIRAAGAAERCGMTGVMLDFEISWCAVMGDTHAEVIGSPILKLEEIEQLSLNEQLVALSFFEDVTLKSKQLVDIDRVRLLKARAVARCLETMSEMRDAVSCAHDFIDKVRLRANVRLRVT